MPLTEKGKKILAEMKKEYGEEKGKEVFYASINKGRITGAEGGGRTTSVGGISNDYHMRKK